MESRARYIGLFDRYLDGSITPEERRELLVFLAKRRNRQEVLAMLEQRMRGEAKTLTHPDGSAAAERIADRVGHRLRDLVPSGADRQPVSRPVAIRLRHLGWAAALLVALSGGWWFLAQMQGPAEGVDGLVATIAAGDRGEALLKRADGSTVRLSGEVSGVVSDRSGVRYDDGTAVLDGQRTYGSPERYELITPRGSMYQVTLADGSRVHLNAGSRLTYPAYFEGDARQVILEGEGFFEIRRMERDGNRVPFLVEARGRTVEVLGTSFSVSAYADEPSVKATLVTGRIRMAAGGDGGPVDLWPGQVAVSTAGRRDIAVLSVDTALAIAWRHGDFAFDDQPLATILRALSRWYPLDVDYGSVPHTRYSGTISRGMPLADVLAILQKTGNLSFTLDGERLSVETKRKF